MTPVRVAMLFPGQGSQRVGMGADLVERYPWLEERFQAADRILGMELAALCRQGPAERLRQTENTQPAVFLASVVALDALRALGVHPVAVAGHSLGEYTALVAAGVLTFEDALRLVRRRGELMAAVNRRTPGTMAAVIGLAADLVERACATAREAGAGVVEVANYNEPAQTVVSGEVAAVERAAVLALEAGAERVAPLEVGAPFHCSLMREVEAEFGEALDAVPFAEPAVPVVANATGDYARTAAAARAALRRQVAGPVQWTGTLRRLAGGGCDCFVEVGPGRVLTGLARRVSPQLPAHPAGDSRRIDLLLSKLQG